MYTSFQWSLRENELKYRLDRTLQILSIGPLLPIYARITNDLRPIYLSPFALPYIMYAHHMHALQMFGCSPFLKFAEMLWYGHVSFFGPRDMGRGNNHVGAFEQ